MEFCVGCKGLVSYDTLNWCQYVAVFATIAREEKF